MDTSVMQKIVREEIWDQWDRLCMEPSPGAVAKVAVVDRSTGAVYVQQPAVDFVRIVETALGELGFEGEKHVRAAVCAYAQVLSHDWHGIRSMALKAANQYATARPNQASRPRQETPQGSGDGTGAPEEFPQEAPDAPPRESEDGTPQDGSEEPEGASEEPPREEPQDDGSEDGPETPPREEPQDGEPQDDGSEGSPEEPERTPQDGEPQDTSEDSADGSERSEDPEEPPQEPEGPEEPQVPQEPEGPEEPPQEDPEEPPQGERIEPKWSRKFRALMRNRIWTCLYGPAGCGKTDEALRIAKELGIEAHVLTAPQMCYDITGFVDANGDYVPTPFTLAFEQGGLCILDEIDRATPEALIALNAPVANRTMHIPGKGQVDASPDFVFVATANTAGTGATGDYNTASKLDASTRDRLAYLECDYDTDVDMLLAGGDVELVDFAHAWRDVTEQLGWSDAVFSYRAIGALRALAGIKEFGAKGALESGLLKGGKSKDDIVQVIGQLKTRLDPENKWLKALEGVKRRL